MKKLCLLLLLITFCFCSVAAGQAITFSSITAVSSLLSTQSPPLVINEFMASNRSSVRDPQGEYDDWIEIYNNSATAVDAGGMYLTDDLSEPTKWQIPASTVITRLGYLLIWADENTTDSGFHANFKLNAAGETIALFDTDGITLIDSVTFGEQNTDISCGRFPDAADNWRIYTDPTPESENTGGLLGQVETPQFSHTRGFYDMPFDVTIATETKGAQIYFTLDGRPPFDYELNEPTGTHLNRPVHITGTTCLRAVAVKPDYKPSRVATHTYIFIDDVARQPANPPGWPTDWGEEQALKVFYITGKIPSDYEMDPRVVDNTLPGYSIRDALLDIPTVCISMPIYDFISNNEQNGIYSNATKSGRSWERRCSIEYILPDGIEGFQHDCKIEVHGGASRFPQRMQKHSLRLTFTSEYGPAKLRYPLFPESPVKEFNQLVLRASFTDSWALVSWDPGRYRPNDSQYIRDVWMKESLRDMGQPSSYGNFVHLYVDGLYFGIHNLTELVASEDFFADHLGGEPEDWEINQDFASSSRWNTIMSINAATPDGYSRIQDYLDVENFADYMLLHFYADAEDWPHHNGHAAANPVSGDGKYRFFVWDQEIVLDNHGLGASRIDGTGGAGSIFQVMRRSTEFRLLFADRVYKQCFNEGALSVTASQDRYLRIANMIDKAIVAESARWGDTQLNTPYGNSIDIPGNPGNPDDRYYPMPPHGPDYYFTREDSWVVERDNIINNYIPAILDTANYYAIINVLRAANLYPDVDPPVYSINGSHQHGGYVTPDAQLTMTSTEGEIFYTLDGSDPYIPGSETAPSEDRILVAENAEKRVLVPTGPVSNSWKGSGIFNDSAWQLCTGSPGGVGYERTSGYQNLLCIDLQDQMYAINTTCYIRIPFNVDEDVTGFDFLKLNVRYDDGFVAYLNGVEVARRNFDGEPTWNSNASFSHSDNAAVTFESINISDSLDALQQGSNILAIQGLNVSTTSSDLLISAELVTGENPEGMNEFAETITLDKSTRVKARAFNGGTWSALNEAVFAVGPVAENLRITEIMYHPQMEPEDMNDPNEEFIELTNIGAEPINLNLVSFTNGIDFTFPDIELAPGDFVVVVENIDAFESRYDTGITIAGEYSGKLNNNGERIRLEDAIGQMIQDFSYSDNWRSITDGEGFSLTIIDPANPDPNSWNEKDSWRPSAYAGGSPGFDDSGIVPNPGAVVINELLANSPGKEPDWIELYNTTNSSIDIGGWFLSDSKNNLTKYHIAEGTTISPNQYIVFNQDQDFGNEDDPGCYEPFALSNNGETVILSSGQDGTLTGYRDVEDFGASQTGVSFGRYYKSSTDNYNFVAMESETPGSANANPKVGPVVINEIMYNPDWPDGGSYTNEQYEYIELYNTSTEPVNLQGWKFTNGIDFTFPEDTPVTIPVSGYILVVREPDAFAWRYIDVPIEKIFGPYEGQLSNAGESLELGMPNGDTNNDEEPYYIRIDRSNYSDGSHPENCPGGIDLWPTEADGEGLSLHRIAAENYGNDPDNWMALTPTPGE
jgi:hypothetical protein